MAVQATEGQLEKLRPYFAGEASPDTGEIDCYCPMHRDENRSAQINPKKGVWYCMAGCGGGTIAQLVEGEGYWVPMEGRELNGYHSNGNDAKKKSEPLPKVSDIRKWHEALMEDHDDAGTVLNRMRGITKPIAIRFKLGWDGKRRLYTIPIYSARGRLWNVRRYNPKVPTGRRKIWGIRGHNAPRLYPAIALVPYDEPIIVCGGEWDALITIQNGFRCITRTAAEHVWKSEWNEYFANRVVYGCHDADDMGEIANGKLRKEMEPIAAEYRTIHLPYPITSKHGRDLTDFWIDGGTPDKFRTLLSEAT